jgi:hypothetical protein
MRTWKAGSVEGGRLHFECRDVIMLQAWLDRTGPYGGDFLIPETLRRRIFRGGKRSGRATRADLLPAYRDKDLPVYDATITIGCGGDRFSLIAEHDAWVFESPFRGDESTTPTFDVVFGDGGLETGEETNSGSCGTADFHATLPVLSLEDFPRWSEFLASVPGLVDSCKVHDLGVPRACPGRYYWIWAWDMLVTASEAQRWGDAELAGEVARFVNGRRDVNGVIPARWTRSLLPLDTPSPGGIEFLFAALAHENFLEGGERGPLSEAYVTLRRLFDGAESEIRDTGAVRGEGFYPDHLGAFGRTPDTSVAMEVGSWYGLARHTGLIARALGDEAVAERMEDTATAIARRFDAMFWDDETGFFTDARNAGSVGPRKYHPLFSLLFLHSSLGFALVRERVARAAAFVEQQLLTEHGMRTVPLGESPKEGETVLDSWYPYWDIAALKLLRRAGRADAIMRWLRLCEETLEELGYCPEFLALRSFREGRVDAWTHHGAASNLNCVTAWSRALREAVFGMDIDPGGMTHIPLMLPVGTASLRNFSWRRGIWSIEIDNAGPFLQEILVDGDLLAGAAKIPIAYATAGEHQIRIRYGHARPDPYFEELVSAELLSAAVTGDGVVARVRGIGTLDATFYSPRPPLISLDHAPLESRWDERTGRGYFGAVMAGEHTLRLG